MTGSLTKLSYCPIARGVQTTSKRLQSTLPPWLLLVARSGNEDHPPSSSSQIRQALSWLHEVGVVWGDVKADNVLIDKDENAIIIDLEGGTTKGWVDHDIGGTVEGDLQGMERLRDFIFNDDSALRTSDGDFDDSMEY